MSIANLEFYQSPNDLNGNYFLYVSTLFNDTKWNNVFWRYEPLTKQFKMSGELPYLFYANVHNWEKVNIVEQLPKYQLKTLQEEFTKYETRFLELQEMRNEKQKIKLFKS